MRMLKGCTAALLCILVSSVSYAQGDSGPDGKFEQWGKVTMDELKMTECKYEKNADAMLLLDLGEIYYNKMDEDAFRHGEFLITNSYYQRYKVFTEKGTRKANRSVTLETAHDEQVKNIKATCYELVNGQIKKTELSPADIHTTKESEHEKKVTFTVPGVSAGCVFEVGYDKIQEVSYSLPTWYFTSDVPTDTSRLSIGFLKCVNYYEDKHDEGNKMTVVNDPFNSNIDVPARFVDMYGRRYLKGNSVTYTCTHLSSYRAEPYINSADNYTTWIRFQLQGFSHPFDDDGSFIKTFTILSDHVYENEMFNLNATKNPIPKAQMKALVHDGMSDDEKAKVIFEYVRDNMEMNGSGSLTPTTPNAELWKNKTGSWADISVLLISALRSEGIKAYPILVGSRYNPNMNKEYPILADFVGINVYVMFADGHTVILDPTDKDLAYGEPDIPQLNTQGLVLQGPDKHYWYDVSDNKESAEKTSIDVQFDETGKITGTARLEFTNHSATRMIRAAKGDDKESLSDQLTRRMPNATIESVSDSVFGSSFVFNVKFSGQAVTDNDGNIYMPVTSAYGEVANPFVNKERVGDVDLAYRNRKDVKMTVHIPAGYMADALPAPESVSMRDTSAAFTASAEVKNGALVMQQSLEYKKSLYKAVDYPSFYDFQKKYYDLRQKPVMLRKKS